MNYGSKSKKSNEKTILIVKMFSTNTTQIRQQQKTKTFTNVLIRMSYWSLMLTEKQSSVPHSDCSSSCSVQP